MIEIKILVTTHMGRTVARLNSPPSPLYTAEEQKVAAKLFQAIARALDSLSEKTIKLPPGDARRGAFPPEGFVPEG